MIGNLFSMLHAYQRYLDEEKSKKEHYQSEVLAPPKTILGVAVGTFVVLLLLNIVIYIWAIIALIRFWKQLNPIVILLSIFFLCTGGGIISLLLIYITKS
jgi:hypothetical protein